MLPFFANTTDPTKDAQPPILFFNTLSKEKERFEPLKDDCVRYYTCGPTVYDYATVGNLRAYVFSDLVRRVLRYNGYKVKHVMNLTDVGHLTSDADTGDDKMIVAIRREGKEMTLEGMRAVADMYIDAFNKNLEQLNILPPHIMPRPSDHIEEQIVLIQTLIEKEYAYRTSDGVYFDTKRFPNYGKLGNIDLEGQQEGARVEENHEKRNPTDFALWKRQDDIGWDSPWGRGFPGWHIECSAMAMKYLGKTFDIHTGGIDHIPTHHNNEIAQSEAATGKPFVRYWMHNAFLTLDAQRIGKSMGNAFTLDNVIEKDINPLAYRYWLMTGHYRSPMNFTWEALEAANQALRRLHRYFFEELYDYKTGHINPLFEEKFHLAINDDLDTPKAIAIVWELVKDDSVEQPDKKATLLHFDKFLAIGLRRELDKEDGAQTIAVLPETIALKDLPEDIRLLVIAREEMREEKKWDRADELRNELQEKGYSVEDGLGGPKITKL